MEPMSLRAAADYLDVSQGVIRRRKGQLKKAGATVDQTGWKITKEQLETIGLSPKASQDKKPSPHQEQSSREQTGYALGTTSEEAEHPGASTPTSNQSRRTTRDVTIESATQSPWLPESTTAPPLGAVVAALNEAGQRERQLYEQLISNLKTDLENERKRNLYLEHENQLLKTQSHWLRQLEASPAQDLIIYKPPRRSFWQWLTRKEPEA